jgi:hypothetical protein
MIGRMCMAAFLDYYGIDGRSLKIASSVEFRAEIAHKV